MHTLAGKNTADVHLPEIPVLDLGPDWPIVSLQREFERTHALLDDAARNLPDFALKLGDVASRRWLAKWDSEHLAEIDEIARHIERPGAYFLNISYEWGCTTRVGPSPSGSSSQLVRVLDWSYKGLGRHVIAAHIDHGATPWISLTWPGYTGVLQAMAPGRFSAALNQAPMETPFRISAGGLDDQQDQGLALAPSYTSAFAAHGTRERGHLRPSQKHAQRSPHCDPSDFHVKRSETK